MVKISADRGVVNRKGFQGVLHAVEGHRLPDHLLFSFRASGGMVE